MQEKLSGARNSGSRWALRDMRFIENHYQDMTVPALAHRLGRTEEAIKTMAKKLGCSTKKAPGWSDTEKAVLYATYANGVVLPEICAKLPGRSPDAVVLMARKLGLARPEPFWLPAEITLLETYYPVEGKSVASRLPARSEESVKLKANALGIRFRGGRRYHVWCDEERVLLEKYDHLPFGELCRLFPDRSKRSVENARRKLRKQRSER